MEECLPHDLKHLLGSEPNSRWIQGALAMKPQIGSWPERLQFALCFQLFPTRWHPPTWAPGHGVDRLCNEANVRMELEAPSVSSACTFFAGEGARPHPYGFCGVSLGICLRFLQADSPLHSTRIMGLSCGSPREERLGSISDTPQKTPFLPNHRD